MPYFWQALEVVDADAKAQAEFWAAVTGWDVHEQDGAPGHAEYAVAAPSPGLPLSRLRPGDGP